LSRSLFAPLTEGVPDGRQPSAFRRTITAAKRPQARRLAGEATTPAVKRRLRDLAAGFERLAEGVDEVASG